VQAATLEHPTGSGEHRNLCGTDLDIDDRRQFPLAGRVDTASYQQLVDVGAGHHDHPCRDNSQSSFQMNPGIAGFASDPVGVRWIGGWRQVRLGVCCVTTDQPPRLHVVADQP